MVKKTKKTLIYLLEKDSSSLSERQDTMLKADGMFLEKIGWSPPVSKRGRVAALVLLSARQGLGPGGKVWEGESARRSGLEVSTMVTGYHFGSLWVSLGSGSLAGVICKYIE